MQVYPFAKTITWRYTFVIEEIFINNKRFVYGVNKQSPTCGIYRVEPMVLHNSSKKVLIPGEFVEVSRDSLREYEGEVAIEPTFNSPNEGHWSNHGILRVIQGRVRIPN